MSCNQENGYFINIGSHLPIVKSKISIQLSTVACFEIDNNNRKHLMMMIERMENDSFKKIRSDRR